jgi:hypothetical protein
VRCEHCGANLALEDMTRPNCPYCGHVLKHHAQAAEHAALVNKIMEQQIGAQYPGMPRDKIPQIGYQYGAQLDPSFGRFQQYQMNNAVTQATRSVKRIVIIMLVASLGLAALGVVVAAVIVAVVAR